MKKLKGSPMKNLIILGVATFFALAMVGCASNKNAPNLLAQISQSLDPAVETLSSDWLKASGFIRGLVGVDNLPKNIVDQLNEIDKWFQDEEGNFIEEVHLNTYRKWYIAGVRVGHTGPVLKALIQQHAPGILLLPEIIAGLAFLGL